jgi:hypothetical protein
MLGADSSRDPVLDMLHQRPQNVGCVGAGIARHAEPKKKAPGGGEPSGWENY